MLDRLRGCSCYPPYGVVGMAVLLARVPGMGLGAVGLGPFWEMAQCQPQSSSLMRLLPAPFQECAQHGRTLAGASPAVS